MSGQPGIRRGCECRAADVQLTAWRAMFRCADKARRPARRALRLCSAPHLRPPHKWLEPLAQSRPLLPYVHCSGAWLCSRTRRLPAQAVPTGPGFIPVAGGMPTFPAGMPGMPIGGPRGPVVFGAPGGFMPSPGGGYPSGGMPTVTTGGTPGAGAVPYKPKRRVATIEDDDGAVLNAEEVEAAKKAAAAPAPVAAPAPAPAPRRAATLEPATPAADSPVPEAAPAPAEAAPAPAPAPAGPTPEEAAAAAAAAEAEAAKAAAAQAQAAAEAAMSPVELLAVHAAKHPAWTPPASLVFGQGREETESRPEGGPQYSVAQLRTMMPVAWMGPTSTPWPPCLPAFLVEGRTAGLARGSFARPGARRAGGKAPFASAGARRNPPRSGGGAAGAGGEAGKSGMDFAALRDPTVLLHSAGTNSFTAQMGRSKPHMEELMDEVTFILNKLARDTFDKLSKQILAVDIRNMEELTAVISVIYDKALEFQKFQDLFADLCFQLTKSAAVWTQGFGHVFQHASGSWYADATGSKTGEVELGEGGKPTNPHVFGPFADEGKASTGLLRMCSFMRLLLNRAQQEFRVEVKFDDLEEAAAKDGAEEAAHKAAGTLTDALADKYQAAREDRQLQHIVRKRRVLSNVSFIGELYKVNIANPVIIDYCIRRLLNGGEDLSGVEEMEALAFCNLMAVVGSKLQEDEGAPKRSLGMSDIMGFLDALYADKSNGSTVRFRALDVKEAAGNGWTFKDHHVAKTKRTMTKEEFRKAEKDKEMAKKVEALRKRQAMGGGGRFDRGGGGRRGYDRGAPQDMRMASDATGPSRHGRRTGGGGGGSSRRLGGRSGGPRTTLGAGRRGGGGAAAPAAAAAGAGASPATGGEVLRGEALTKRVGSFFVDWGSNLRTEDRALMGSALADTPAGKEAVQSMTDIAASPGLGAVLVAEAVQVVKDAKEDKARSDAGLLLSLAHASGRVAAADVTAGLAATMANYKDYKAYDLPKVDTYLGLLLAPLVAHGHLDTATLVALAGQGTGFFAASGLALLGAVVAAAAAVEGATFTLDGAVSLLPLAGPCSFDLRGFRNNLKAALEVPAVAGHPDAPVLSALLAWREATDRKDAATGAAEWAKVDAGASAPAAAASAILQLVSDAQGMGFGEEGGAKDVAALAEQEAAVKAIAEAGRAAGAGAFSAFLLEGLGRTVVANTDYGDKPRGAILKAYVTFLQGAGALVSGEVKAWRPAEGPHRCAIHTDLAKHLAGVA